MCVVCLGIYTTAHVIQLCGVCCLLPPFHGFRDRVQGTRLAQACASPTEPSIFIYSQMISFITKNKLEVCHYFSSF